MFDIVIVGAGPSGLSCAIEAKRAGLSAVVLDKGSVVDAIRRFPTHLTWFSTPELLEIGNVPFVTAGMRPTRVEAIKYYQRVVEHYDLDVRTFEPVEDIRRRNGGFLISTQRQNMYESRNVVIATGYFDHPNRLGVPGENLPNVFYYYREPFEFFRKSVVVVGGRNSAVEAALDLYRHGAGVTLIHRGPELSKGVKYWILPDIENRIKNGEIQALFNTIVLEILPDRLAVRSSGEVKHVRHDFTFVLIGFRPDTEHLRRFGIEIDPETLAPIHNPETYETNVPGLYVCGSIVAGKNNNKVFVENGRLHGASIVAAILQRHRTV